jgi:Fe-S oxidoreductase
VRINSRKKSDDNSGYDYLKAVRPFNALGRVAYFGGCMSRLTPSITEAMERIFQASGTPYWYMDKERSICCGRPLLQQGFESQARELRRKNTQLIKESGATMLVTSCPICYQSFTKEYNLPVRVMHHTEFIEQLLRSGQLKLKEKSALRVTYHDPCELGRGSGIYDPPRQVLEQVVHLLPTQHERERSLCCGFNLGNTVLSTEQQTEVRERARQNLLEPHPDMIATACPMCKKAFARGTDTMVRDVAEIVAEGLLESAVQPTHSTRQCPSY